MCEPISKRDQNAKAELEPGFKMTELGPLPKNWDVVELKELFKLVDKKERQVTIRDSEVYRLLTVRLYAKGIVIRAIEPGTRIGVKFLYRTEAGDFVFSKIDARNGAWGFVKPELAGSLVSGDFPILKLNEAKAEQDFINFLLGQPAIWEPLRNIAVGTTHRRRVQVPQLLGAKVPLPPMVEQHDITDILSNIQRGAEKAGRVIDAARELKKSLMRHLFTYGPVPYDQVDNVPLKETEIGLVPEHWSFSKLGELCTISTGTTPSTKNKDYYVGNVAFIKTSGIANNIITNALVHISDKAVEDYNLKLYEPGTVFLAMYGQGKTRGQVALLEISAATTQNTAAIVPSDKLDSKFLWLYLMSQYERLRGAGIHGQISHLNLGYVKQLYIPLPPLPEQQEIAQILQAVDHKIEAEENRKRALETLFKTLLHYLMTGKIRAKDLAKVKHEA